LDRTVGTVIRGVRTPVIRKGDNLVEIVAESLAKCRASEGFAYMDGDVVGVTEAVVARAQGNYADIASIAEDVKSKMRSDEFAVMYPILSRNRFAVCLKGIAMAARKIHLVLSYPADEFGNHLFDERLIYKKSVNPWYDELTYDRYRELFGYPKHSITGMDYVEYYRKIVEDYGAEFELLLCNNVANIAKKFDDILLCSVHNIEAHKEMLLENGTKRVVPLSEILNKKVPGCEGYNERYGLLGSNKSTEEAVKLFPRDCEAFVAELQDRLAALTGKKVEVIIFGDGAFKDPVSKIWELADPVVSPAYSKGLDGMTNEIKLKYVADIEFASLSGEMLVDAVKKRIGEKDGDLRGSMAAMGTTPRRLNDLLGSLCDLTSGSGDKGTPVVYIQGYFDNFSS